MMELKEKIAYIVGTIIILYGAYAGRDLTKMDQLIEGTALVAFFVFVFIVFFYLNKRGIGDWYRKYND